MVRRLGFPCVILVALLSACGESGSAAPTCGANELVVAASDYSSSAVGGSPAQGRVALAFAGPDLGHDPALASSTDRLFFLARDTDLVFELDKSCGAPRSKVSVHDLAPTDPRTNTTGTANPHDVAAAPDGSLWVPLWNVPRIAIAKNGVVTSLDISSYDDDGNPQAEAIRIIDVGGVPKAFVALERLADQSTPKFLLLQESTMLRIDVATRTVEAQIKLEGRNPFNTMPELDGALFMAEPGNFDILDEPLAGIERFDTATSTSKLLVPEKWLGGSVSEIAVRHGCGAAIVANAVHDVNSTSLVTFDPVDGRVLSRDALTTAGYDLQGLAWQGSVLYVGDRRESAVGFRVHVFESDQSCILRESPRSIDLTQRPVALRPAR